ncbi:hypothetical protein, partial [[Kitasatospora] papulosa]|uniref:hypothetical protein n=1 Tax=[Kitasatospora] papulosa TaxID=1464011 RepID=UPI0036F0A13B
MDSIVNTFTKGYYFTFRGDDSVIRDKLSLMFQLLDKRTGGAPRKLTDPFPILRKFNFALQANDKEEAEKQIQLLERYRLLDPRNILFIRIELLAHFERWNEIINHRQIDDLIMASRPSGITESLIRSVFQVYLSRHINDVESLKTVFREEVWPQYQSLYHVRGSLAHPETLISFMLRAVDPETPQYELQHDLLVAGKGTKVESLLLALAQSGEVIKKTEIGSPSLEVAKSIADRGQFEEALAIALNLNSSVEQIQLLLLCAFEIQDFKVDKQVVDKVSHLKEEDWQSILTSRQLRVCYEYLSPYLQFSFDLDIPARLPVNWNEWLERYNEFGRSAALELAKRGFGEWGRTNFLHSEEERETFLKHLRRDTEAEKEALPYLIRYLEKDPKWPRSELKEVYLEIHRHLLTGMQGDSSEMKLAATWSEALVQIGLSSLQYNQLFEQLSSAWKRNASTKFLDMLYP